MHIFINGLDVVHMSVTKTNKDLQYRTILNCILKNTPISRVEIYKSLNISKPTITRAIECLIQDGFVIEEGSMTTSSGRKPISLNIVPNAGFAIGINMNRTNLSFVITNLKMDVKYFIKKNISHIIDSDSLMEEIYFLITNAMQATNLDESKILGISIASPGYINVDGSILDYIIETEKSEDDVWLTKVDIKNYLETRLPSIPVYVENDCNLKVLAEYWYGFGGKSTNLLYVACEEGIGSGFVFNGNILKGRASYNSGIGHMSIDINGNECTCGRKGCIETFATTKVISHKVRDRINDIANQSTKDAIIASKYSVEVIGNYADRGEKVCKKVMIEAANAIGIGIANLGGILNPDVVIMSGASISSSHMFYENIVKTAKKEAVDHYYDSIEFIKRNTDDWLYNVTPVTLVLKTFFEGDL